MQPEQQIKKEIRKNLTSNGIYWDNVAQGQYSKPGQPDLILCHNGKFVQVEVKTPTGKQSEIQKVREREIHKSGGKYLVVHSWDELYGNIIGSAE